MELSKHPWGEIAVRQAREIRPTSPDDTLEPSFHSADWSGKARRRLTRESNGGAPYRSLIELRA